MTASKQDAFVQHHPNDARPGRVAVPRRFVTLLD